ncbi:Wzz/FepE/Etk N-terminal domain-containing protein [Bosea sp. PAMC 26642]|uniref:Wzz/FepE/Etk N-terminal domain-containing protein n=1 Tax=Bosea sp. (strain PAMC 26642) TaxID=1792307 RepID=UPI0012E966E8|nr:Wzz/FepE/Etk N-terminal domain-containing protein [Bosea sp. PAMC 26642]
MIHQRGIQPVKAREEQGEGIELNFDEVFAIMRARWRLIAICVFMSVAFAVAYLMVTVPQYTSVTSILIDTKTNVLPSQQVRASDANSESANVETQAEILRSERIARAVIKEQKLAEHPDFAKSDKFNPISFLRSFLKTPTEETGADGDVSASAVKEYKSRIDVKRSTSTYIIEISFKSSDPKTAADTANAVAKAYLSDQLNQREELIRSTSQWLNQRSIELRAAAHAAETALDQFRNTQAQTAGNALGRVALRDLESTAQTYRVISDSFQKRFLETSQGQTFALPDARIVSEAYPPLDKSHPKSLLTLAVGFAVGLSIGFLAALARGFSPGSRQPRPAKRTA